MAQSGCRWVIVHICVDDVHFLLTCLHNAGKYIATRTVAATLTSTSLMSSSCGFLITCLHAAWERTLDNKLTQIWHTGSRKAFNGFLGMWCITQGLILYHTALQGFHSSHTIMSMMSSMNWVCALVKENVYKKSRSIKQISSSKCY